MYTTWKMNLHSFLTIIHTLVWKMGFFHTIVQKMGFFHTIVQKMGFFHTIVQKMVIFPHYSVENGDFSTLFFKMSVMVSRSLSETQSDYTHYLSLETAFEPVKPLKVYIFKFKTLKQLHNSCFSETKFHSPPKNDLTLESFNRVVLWFSLGLSGTSRGCKPSLASSGSQQPLQVPDRPRENHKHYLEK